MERVYPTSKGVPLSPYELRLPPSHLDLEESTNWNNHHAAFTRQLFGRSIILRTFRNLERNQYTMPIDVHTALHYIYEPPELPTPQQAMFRVIMAYSHNEPLKFGSANNPTFQPITNDLIKMVNAEYNQIKE